MTEPNKDLPVVQKFKNVINADSVQEQFRNALKEGASLFVASLIDIYSNDTNLQKCPPKSVIMEALKAATLKLPINKSLGFAYIVPYGNEPNFQLGYKGYIQLAMRTGQYKYINADVVYQGELVYHDKLTGEIKFGEAQSDAVIGYFAHFETINGFRKTIYWTKDQVTKHAQKFSKSYHSKNSAWKTDFEAMALKTLIRHLLSKYGIMSVEIMNGLVSDSGDERSWDEQVQEEVDQNANSETLDIEADDPADEGPEF